MSDLISREALKEDFKSRLAPCNEWIEKAKDKETKIRASAVKAYLAEVIMTIDNAPAVENVTVFCENADEKAIADLKEELQKVIAEKRPKGEWIDYNAYYKTCPFCKITVGIDFLTDEPQTSNFCPKCGADMKGGAE